MKLYYLAGCLFGLGLMLNAGSAKAGPETFTANNTTTVDGSDGSIYTAPNNYIGTPFQTTAMSVVENGSTATINYYTAFNGSNVVAGYTVGYADIFFGGIGAGYAISFGDQTANGGVSQAGVYKAGGEASSQQIWGTRSGVTYGAAYNGGQTAYTVVTGGSLVEGVTITDTQMMNGQYDLAVTFGNLPFDLVQAFENGSLTAFWGTGDCANGAFLVQVSEPASYAALLFGVLMIGFISWKRGAPNTNFKG
jgi:hypothetical protein